MRVADNITELVGDTPMITLNKLQPENAAKIYVKLEMFNPSGSVKDRAAVHMIHIAEQEGLIKAGDTIIEPTSGNTGIGLAMAASAKGYQAILVMPDNSTQERRNLLKAYGAKVVLTPSSEKMPGAIQKALELQQEIPNSFIPQQFKNIANPDAHRNTTALEILNDLNHQLDAFVCTAGTGGTVTGTGESLRSYIPDLHIAVVEPKGSPVLSGGEPGSHKLVGTSPGFVPEILNTSVYDEIIQINDEQALSLLKELAQKEGLFVGPSGAAAIYAATEVAKRMEPEQKVVCIAPDTGERYLSMDFLQEEE
ncbi:cysteine synthase [Oceanobacillus oncorhynchi subsp. incaldanensis]|uniref:Cysteine synthase n=1 Tax=Oceanobacillus oncorhynchi TaxID=545501 RepID=A0A0A1MK94_9BACI|nr:cysteine synthase A [Oceanobacillus oncorhynchi]GIO21236.1 cysteine synthase [Oceanobacillus oncorhynchi subsp. incaldanensis]CEI83523.1 Cysteine synthase [Oceanobacillus oncorhynchi]